MKGYILTVKGAPLSLKNLTMLTMRSRMSCLKSPVEGFSDELWYTSALRGIVTFTLLPRPAFMSAACTFWRAGNDVARKVPLNVDKNGSFPTATYLQGGKQLFSKGCDKQKLYLIFTLLDETCEETFFSTHFSAAATLLARAYNISFGIPTMTSKSDPPRALRISASASNSFTFCIPLSFSSFTTVSGGSGYQTDVCCQCRAVLEMKPAESVCVCIAYKKSKKGHNVLLRKPILLRNTNVQSHSKEKEVKLTKGSFLEDLSILILRNVQIIHNPYFNIMLHSALFSTSIGIFKSLPDSGLLPAIASELKALPLRAELSLNHPLSSSSSCPRLWLHNWTGVSIVKFEFLNGASFLVFTACFQT
nr:hypothetical protein Iba_chr01aCG7680 [Ipomoea batatas]